MYVPGLGEEAGFILLSKWPMALLQRRRQILDSRTVHLTWNQWSVKAVGSYHF